MSAGNGIRMSEFSSATHRDVQCTLDTRRPAAVLALCSDKNARIEMFAICIRCDVRARNVCALRAVNLETRNSSLAHFTLPAPPSLSPPLMQFTYENKQFQFTKNNVTMNGSRTRFSSSPLSLPGDYFRFRNRNSHSLRTIIAIHTKQFSAVARRSSYYYFCFI